ncbi:TPA: transcriptional regulator [Streptococcus suis]|nr:transcriptional regulator [Streptococcus suis]
MTLGNAGASFLDKEQVRNYYLEARELCRIYNNPLMLMKIESFLSQLENTSHNSSE